MKRLIIKVKVNNQTKPLSYELSGEQPIKELIPHLVQGMGWSMEENGQPLKYWFTYQDTILDSARTLLDCNVNNSDVLFLRSGTEIPRNQERKLKTNPFDFTNKASN